MKKRILQIALVVILLADMMFIFLNSAQDAGDSGRLSASVTERIAEVVVPSFEELSPDERERIVSELDGFVRECAHLLQFVPIGLALFMLLFTLSAERRRAPVWVGVTEGFGFLYALSDEIHQYFVPGRAFQWGDIGLDVLGVTLGCVLSAAVCFLYLYVKGKRSD